MLHLWAKRVEPPGVSWASPSPHCQPEARQQLLAPRVFFTIFVSLIELFYHLSASRSFVFVSLLLSMFLAALTYTACVS